MRYYPVFLDIRGRPCLVIGGGKVAERKTLSLLEADARVTVISPSVTRRLNKLHREGRIEYLPRPYEKGDIRGFYMVFSATDNRVVNRLIAEEAKEERVFLNVVDEPELCDFIVPSVVKRGDLLIAISTSGKSPALARRIRMELEERFGDEYACLLEILGKIRVKLTDKRYSSYNKNLYNMLLNSPILEYIRDGRKREVDLILAGLLGEDFSLESLGVRLPGEE